MIEERKGKHGTSFRVRVYGPDGRKKSKTFTRITLAKEWERRALRETEEQEASGIIVNDEITLEDFAARWLQEKVKVRLSRSTQGNYERVLRIHVLPLFGKVLLRNIRVDHANMLVSRLSQNGHSPKGINSILGVLLTVLNDAVEWQCLTRSPLFRYRPVKEPELYFDYWTAPEVQQFLNATKFDRYHWIYVMALNTGMRRGEICALKWDRIDLIRKQIVVSRSLSRFGLQENTKSGKKRYVPISPLVKTVLERLFRLQRSEFVFSREDGSPVDAHHLSRDFKLAQQRAGFSRTIRFHDMRHTFASHFMMNDGNIYDLQKILGHATLEMTQRYAHMSPDHLAEAIQIVSFAAEENSNVLSMENIRETKG